MYREISLICSGHTHFQPHPAQPFDEMVSKELRCPPRPRHLEKEPWVILVFRLGPERQMKKQELLIEMELHDWTSRLKIQQERLDGGFVEYQMKDHLGKCGVGDLPFDQ